MTRRPFIAGNWKLNLPPEPAAEVARKLRHLLADRGNVDVAVFPTALSITAVLDCLQGTGIEVGVQEVHPAASGAFTGANSPAMARKIGCTRALVGHSERRQIFGETDRGVNQKVKACLAHGLLPVVCIGETLEQRQADQVDLVVHGQLATALDGLQPDQLSALTLAYEPVWAIGTGQTATPDQAQAVHASIRGWLRAHFPAYVAEEMRIQYGGSVKPANAAELLRCPDIDGALVGGASLDPDSFAGIITAVG
ncbi:MAG: triose-phosphate isomerase [Deltaproteobacteria bacterium]|nr:triose-phosphate isomerase [Deltaproteobacteria bacterium]